MSVRGVEHQAVDARIDERFGSVHVSRAVAYSRADEQSAVLVLGGVGILYRFFYILYRYKPFKAALAVDDRQFFYPVLAENFLRLLERRADGRGDEPRLGHDVFYGLSEIGLEPEIAVSQYADELTVLDDGHARDLVLVHKLERVADLAVGLEEERVRDNAVLAALDLVDVLRLVVYAHVLMYDADTALASNRNGEPRFGNGVHSRGYERYVERDVSAELGRQIDVLGRHLGFARDKQNVVESQSVFYDFTHKFLLFVMLLQLSPIFLERLGIDVFKLYEPSFVIDEFIKLARAVLVEHRVAVAVAVGLVVVEHHGHVPKPRRH